jgi:ATP-dependent Lhr-like helicase
MSLPGLAADVFRARYGEPTRAQALAWPAIAAGEHALVIAPTGSGKTLAAFYAFLARMIETPPAARGIELVYVSPLKALATDIERNLRAPLLALTDEALRRGLTPAPVTVQVRTGDTPAAARSAMTRRPPRVLVTTPESLYLLLTSAGGRESLGAVRAVIVDEVHALVPGKRGVHLALSLERLELLTGRPVQRIGLSATVAPPEEAARWLGGRDAAGAPRPVTILDAGERKEIDVAVIAPADPAVVGPRGMWPPIAAELAAIVERHRSTLIFCSSRRLAERVTGMVNAAAGRPLALSHHGSVSKERRQDIEAQLKAGQLRAVVATGSLELGIDVGAVDCVVQVQSPKAVSRALQRIGRSGHVVGGVPKGRVVPTHRADFVECAAVARAVLARAVEETRSPRACLDVLAQQIVAEVAAARGGVAARELYAAYRRAEPYHLLPWEDFAAVIEMLAGRYQSSALRDMRPRLDWDRRRGRLAALPGTRLVATSRPGTIPDRGLFRVEREETREKLGELDEEFVFESRVGEVFVLGATPWRITRIQRDRVIVRAAGPGEPARMPFWRGEGPGRSLAVGAAVGALVREIGERLEAGDEAARAHVRATCAADEAAARAVVDHVARQRQSGAPIPDDRTVVVELYEDELGDARVALLSPFGGRVHAAWAILVAAEARARLGLDVPHAPADDGVLFRAPGGDAAERLLGMARWIPAAEAAARLDAEIEGTPLYQGLFRDAAQRALILPGRGPKGRMPLWLARLRAADLAQLMGAHPDFPVAREARREALEEALDVAGLVALLSRIEKGELRVVTVKRSLPSPFASQLELAFTTAFLYEGDSPRLERRARALAAGPAAAAVLLSPEELEDLIDPDAVARLEQARQHVAPGTRARTPEELAEVLRRLSELDDAELAARFDGDAAAAIEALYRAGRIARRRGRWILDEDTELWRDLDDPVDAGRAARAELAQRFAAARGPFTTGELAARHGLPEEEAAEALEALARDGQLLRGRFLRGAREATWCDRRNLAEAHRRTLALLRDHAAPVGVARLAQFLLERQGAADVAGAVRLLSGFAAPQETLERDLLWRRVSPYHPPLLDAACAAGEVVWSLDGPRLTVAPRGELEVWHDAPAMEPSPDEAAVLAALEAGGALFGPELVERARLAGAAAYVAVWSLIRKGQVTNDAYEALRRAVAAGFDPVEAGLDLGAARLSLRQIAAKARRSPWVGRFSRAPAWTGSPEERAALQAAILLRRYGVVGKAVAAAEPRALPWPLLEEALARLELRGEVVRGLFVDGLGPYQVALPEAVDELRAARDASALALVSACDPACPYGALAPEAEGRVARLPSSYLVLRGGAPLLLVEGFGKRVTPLSDAPDDVVAAGLATLRGLLAVPAHLRGVRAVTVHRFGDREAAEAQALFARAGFTRDGDRMVLSAV